MRYGLPYKGSKNSIAKWIISQLPTAETFVDLFFGGGAVMAEVWKRAEQPDSETEVNKC